MSTAEEVLDCDAEQVIAHSKNDDGPKPFKLNSHKRVDSRELSQVGAQFRLPAKQNSIPRPPYIDIDHDEVSHVLQNSSTGDLAHVPASTQEQRPPDYVCSKGGSPSIPYFGLPLGSHHYSEEDVAILIYHRDKGKERAVRDGMHFPLYWPESPDGNFSHLSGYMSYPHVRLLPTNFHNLGLASIDFSHQCQSQLICIQELLPKLPVNRHETPHHQ
jgi:hypothetical protein